ncbi:MAG: hypothetical protein ACLQPH_00245 [Acidimicrobiales bacterium]
MTKVVAAFGGAVVLAYAWWATGVPPFTNGAYAAVGIPVLALALLVVVGRPGDHPPGSRSAAPTGRVGGSLPWLALALVALSLEAAGLALGGRSTAVPTLSTVVDHALAWHAVRFALFCGWLAAGFGPLVRRAATGTEARRI